MYLTLSKNSVLQNSALRGANEAVIVRSGTVQCGWDEASIAFNIAHCTLPGHGTLHIEH